MGKKIMKFIYFPGDSVINQKPHYDTESRLVPMYCSGRVEQVHPDNGFITVKWEISVQGVVSSTITSVTIDYLKPHYVAPKV